MTTTIPREQLASIRRTLANMRTVVRRPAEDLRGRNARGVAGHYRKGLTALLVLEDLYGAEAVAPFADRLTALRIEATGAGLISPADIIAAECRAVVDADAAAERRARRAAEDR